MYDGTDRGAGFVRADDRRTSRGSDARPACCDAQGRLPPECPGWCAWAAPPGDLDPGASNLREGSLVAGRWRLRFVIGRGAMGRVFEAEDEHEHRAVAVKVLPLRDDGLHALRFVTEGRALAMVEHPHVVRALATGIDAGQPYHVMELVRGASLAARLADRSDPLGLAEGIGIVAEVCAGAAAIHAAGLVHRDLKPANVLLDASRGAMIVDFGLAMPCSPVCRLGDEIVGTPAYMAPEIAAATALWPTVAADVYALGVLAFEVLTGHRPFQSDARDETLAQQVHRGPPSVRVWRPSLPSGVDDVLRIALAKDPAQRHADASSLAAALAAALA